jgi:hypothetical protein
VPAWKGEVVHPGAPESQCVYKIRCYRILSVRSLYKLNGNMPRDHKYSGAYKVPQFLERQLLTAPRCIVCACSVCVAGV